MPSLEALLREQRASPIPLRTAVRGIVKKAFLAMT
jgi:hypothetical protein